MKFIALVSLTLVSSMAFANLGGMTMPLRGYYECGPEDGVSLELNIDKGTGKLIGQNTIDLIKTGSAARNGNALVVFEGSVDEGSFEVRLESLMGAKVAKFSHPGTGQDYLMGCRAAKPKQSGGF
jgi:hypothetical protein